MHFFVLRIFKVVSLCKKCADVLQGSFFWKGGGGGKESEIGGSSLEISHDSS